MMIIRNFGKIFIGLSVLIVVSYGFVQEEPKSGEELYGDHCQSCHMKKGKGFFRMYPPLDDKDWVGDDQKIVKIMTTGLKGEIAVHNKAYDNEMPPMDYLEDDEIAKIINYVRNEIAEVDQKITAQEVKELRKVKE